MQEITGGAIMKKNLMVQYKVAVIFITITFMLYNFIIHYELENFVIYHQNVLSCDHLNFQKPL